MAVSELDILMEKLSDLWESAIGGCFSILHPHYLHMGAVGLTFPLEWSNLRQDGKRKFIAWAVMEVKKKHPDFKINVPSLDYYDETQGGEISNWIITSKEHRDSYLLYDKRSLNCSAYYVADIIAMRRDAVENNMSIEDIAKKYKHSVMKTERALYFKATIPVEEVTPQLNVPYGKKVL